MICDFLLRIVPFRVMFEQLLPKVSPVPSSIYVINPACDFPTYFGAEVLNARGRPGIMMADLTSVTVAGLAPRDFDISICDESIEPVNFDHHAESILITGKISQRRRMAAIAAEFRRRGKRIVIGGPFASLSPDLVRDHCDVLVRGEAEGVAEQLFADLRARKPKDEYVGDKPDLSRTPPPRWDLYRNDRALLGAIQTSRGCPFECEFCDVIQYLGRKQRHKPVASVLAEMDVLYSLGYRLVFLADDNLTAYRSRCKELLEAIAWWRRDKHMNFVSQVSIDVTRDEEMLRMMVAAGVSQVFVGIETPNVESLRETGKRQNMKVDLAAEVQKLVDYGISVMGGMIVGFDADGPGVFKTQYDFAMSTPVPMFSLGGLIASDSTPLKERIVREGRLAPLGDTAQGVPWASNIVPTSMTTQQLDEGLQHLANVLYSPEAFGERMLNFIATFGRASPDMIPDQMNLAMLRDIDKQCLQVSLDVRRMGEAERRMWSRIWTAAAARPVTIPLVTRILVQYAQARYMFDAGQYWEPHLANKPFWPSNTSDSLLTA
jgi:hypothetical protein